MNEDGLLHSFFISSFALSIYVNNAFDCCLSSFCCCCLCVCVCVLLCYRRFFHNKQCHQVAAIQPIRPKSRLDSRLDLDLAMLHEYRSCFHFFHHSIPAQPKSPFFLNVIDKNAVDDLKIKGKHASFATSHALASSRSTSRSCDAS